MRGLIREVIANGWVDEEFISARTLKFDDVRAAVDKWTPEAVARTCGVSASDVRRAAEIFGTSERPLSTVLQGFHQSSQATASACQVNNLHLMRGKIGRPGCGILRLCTEGLFPTNPDRCETFGHDLLTGATVGEQAYRTKTARTPQLNAADPHVWVEVSSADAQSLGVSEGDEVSVRSRRGHPVAQATISDIRPCTLFAPFHDGYRDAGGEPGDAPTAANARTLTEWNPVSTQPAFKNAAVVVERMSASSRRAEPCSFPSTLACSRPAGLAQDAHQAGRAAGPDRRRRIAGQSPALVGQMP